MPSFVSNQTVTTTLSAVTISAAGVMFVLTLTRPDGTSLGSKTLTIQVSDKSLRDDKGNILYADVTTIAAGILGDLVNLVSKLNTIHGQAITDGKVAP